MGIVKQNNIQFKIVDYLTNNKVDLNKLLVTDQ